MAAFSHNVNKIPGLRFIADMLELQSGIGRMQLMKQPFMTLTDEINSHLDKVEELANLLISTQNQKPLTDRLNDTNKPIDDLKHALSEIHDITGTLNALHSGMVLDDIGLYEVKKLALITERVTTSLAQLKTNIVRFSDAHEVIRILDPEKQYTPHFYIYDSYSERLKDLRKQYNQYSISNFEQASDGESKQALLNKAEEIRLQCFDEEDAVRKNLSLKLRRYSIPLRENLSLLADLDLYLAKAILARSVNFCRPTIAKKNKFTSFEGLFNPQINALLQEKNKEFQPVDIKILQGPAVITGANMAGKTVLLKTITLAQYLFQYGFFIPAISAEIAPVDKIITSIEDEQSELKGLSSFAAEMLKINSIIHASRTGEKILALIDEPARTTNPQEGLAIVNALVDELVKYKVRSLITTHYSSIISKVRHLRVAGLKTEELSETASIETINDYMDYSIIELGGDDINDAPHEALNIAKILGVDSDLLNLAEKYLNQQINTDPEI